MLQSPPIYSSNIRSCEFVESLAVFVNVDGKVSPCYYLWHDFSCYIGGLKKDVRAWFLGSLSEGTRFRRKEDVVSFRAEVMKYKSPFCYDCSFALCNLVDSVDFENDCYLSSVPCESCLWCTGLFHCMF